MKKKDIDPKGKIIINELRSYQKKDFSFSSGHILGSMCSSPHPIAKQAYYTFLETNLGDPALFPGTKTIEKKLLSYIKTLLHAPETAQGHIVSGGTEGNITAIWIAKELSRKKTIVVPSSAHFSIQKIAKLMDMNIKTVPLTDQYTVDVTQLKKAVNTDTAAVLGIAGSTDLGTIDPIEEIGDFCYDEHLYFHVDAAFGGFIIPFLTQKKYNIKPFDFNIKGVSSISLDAHKMGYAAIPLGVLVIRKKNWLDAISVTSHCVSSEKQAGILGTRSGGPVAAAYAVIQYLGNKGYQEIMQNCIALTRYTANRIKGIGLSLIIDDPPLNVLAIKLKKPDIIVDKLTAQGWKVNTMKHLSSIRLVLMPHITKKTIDDFIPVLHNICKEEGEL